MIAPAGRKIKGSSKTVVLDSPCRTVKIVESDDATPETEYERLALQNFLSLLALKHMQPRFSIACSSCHM